MQRKRCTLDDNAAAVEHCPRDEAYDEADAAAAVDQVDVPPHLEMQKKKRNDQFNVQIHLYIHDTSCTMFR
mgnify:CR=1 FL=1